MRFESFAHLLSHYTNITPDAAALIYESGEKKICTFRQLNELVNKRAEELRKSGKSCLGILSDGSFDCVVSIFAANLAGLQLVMLDANSTTDVLGMLIEYTDVDLLWGDEELKSELTGHLTDGVKNGKGKLLFFTSGTTDKTKAVVLTDRSLMNSAYNGYSMLPLSQNDILMCMLPLNHVFGFVCGLLWGLSSGACVALGRGARHYADDCTFFHPTVLSAVPMLLGMLVRYNFLNPELRIVLVGAGNCPEQLLQAVSASGIRVCFGYGLTETSSGVAISVRGNPYALEICPDDEITLADDGEILIKSTTCMMEGYYKHPEDTKNVLQDGILYTGDIGRFDSKGRLYITGRKKEMLVLEDGTKIFLPEYEGKIAALLGNPEIAVVLRNGRLILIIFENKNEKPAILQKLKALMETLPRGQQLNDIEFTNAPLPRTATGKIQRYILGGENNDKG